jgi:two-component system, response regulator
MNGRLVLLVEDNPADAALTMHALRRNATPHEVVLARDGAEALDLLDELDDRRSVNPQRVPALILLDLKLPKVDGFEVLRRIRHHERLRMVPIVVLTSSIEEQDVLRCYRLGANSYLRKPIDFSQFNEVVREVLTYWLEWNQVPPQHPARVCQDQ